jgi:hypothetical protein
MKGEGRREEEGARSVERGGRSEVIEGTLLWAIANGFDSG